MAIKDIEYVKELRKNGVKYQDIAEKLGISKQQAWNIAKQAGIVDTHDMKKEKVIYKGVKSWLFDNEISLHDLCIKCGELCGANSRTYKFLVGKNKGDILIIQKVMSVCDMSFEDAFGEVENENEKENKNQDECRI